jgi:limonene 1,2-monooxygenase
MDDLCLRSGIFLAPFHNHDENPTLSIERDLELIEHLDRLNYHEAWIGEHHSGGFELIASPEMFIAVAAQRTRHIRLGTGVVSLPYHNPFMLRDRMVQLDHMTRGRAMFGVGPGALVHDALAQSTDHVRDFFGMLQVELAFYVGCVRLHEQLARKGSAVCMPEPAAVAE